MSIDQSLALLTPQQKKKKLIKKIVSQISDTSFYNRSPHLKLLKYTNDQLEQIVHFISATKPSENTKISWTRISAYIACHIDTNYKNFCNNI